MAMYAKVRRMRLREGLAINEIARRTGFARKHHQGVAAGAGPRRDAVSAAGGPEENRTV